MKQPNAVAVNVADFDALKTALLDVSITEIIISSDITFTSSITNIPLRDVTVSGNGHVLTTNAYTITGQSSNVVAGIIRFNTMTVKANEVSGRLFEHVSSGWEVHATDVTYTGARFVHLSNGDLFFAGVVSITTSCENAWVKNVHFAQHCQYTGIAAQAGQFSAFYFNGASQEGKAIIDSYAVVNITISQEYYPAFWDRVDTIEVMEYGSLTINAAGQAIHFYRQDMDNPASVIVHDNATLVCNSLGEGNREAIRYDTSGNFTVGDTATLSISGGANLATIPVIYMADSSSFTLGKVANAKIWNKTADAPLFYALNTALRIDTVSQLSLWAKIGGEYDGSALVTWAQVSLATSIDRNESINTTSNNPSLQDNFQLSDYGCIALLTNPPAK